ncbi:MAG TPA: transcription antitermination factor NusB [Verrucomicrobiales bacterium]|nr:transcription antitermination factor NusB [Verrucomicrobiales bacterium]
MSKKPGKRREAREAAVQFLFSRDLNAGLAPDPAQFDLYWEFRPADPRVRAFSEELVRGAIEHLPAIDASLRDALENYRLERVGAVDRNILRLAVYEILFCNDIPRAVAINEAIEIARRLGGDESPRFVNGVLDRIQRPTEA